MMKKSKKGFQLVNTPSRVESTGNLLVVEINFQINQKLEILVSFTVSENVLENWNYLKLWCEWHWELLLIKRLIERQLSVNCVSDRKFGQ